MTTRSLRRPGRGTKTGTNRLPGVPGSPSGHASLSGLSEPAFRGLKRTKAMLGSLPADSRCAARI